MAAVDPHAWPRLGQLVRERREALRISQGAAGVSVATWRKVEHAVDPPYRRSTLLAIERVLNWAPGSIDRILEGGDPIEARAGTPPASSADRLQALEREIADLRAELTELRKVHLVDLDDPDERRIWELDLPEDERWREILRWRAAKADRDRRAG